MSEGGPSSQGGGSRKGGLWIYGNNAKGGSAGMGAASRTGNLGAEQMPIGTACDSRPHPVLGWRGGPPRESPLRWFRAPFRRCKCEIARNAARARGQRAAGLVSRINGSRKSAVRSERPLREPGDAREDLVGRLRPHERAGARVVLVEKLPNRPLGGRDAAMARRDAVASSSTLRTSAPPDSARNCRSA